MKTYIYKQPHIAETLITLQEVKEQLKLNVAQTYEDDLLNQYRDAAIKFAEDYTSRNFNQAKYQIQLFGFVNFYALPKSPVTAIDSIQYLDESGVWQTLDSQYYELLHLNEYQSEVHYIDDEQALPTVKSGAGIRVKINITVGYATAADLPEQDKQAIYLIFSFFYEKRDDSVQQLPRASTNLLTKFIYVNG